MHKNYVLACRYSSLEKIVSKNDSVITAPYDDIVEKY